MSHEKQKPLAGWALVALVCLWVLASTGFEGLEFAQSIRWQSTTATVQKTVGPNERDVDGSSDSLSYAFQIDGVNYESSRIKFAEFQRASERRRTFDQYADGSEVVVYYNPMNPEKSVLVRQLEPAGCLWFALSLIGLTLVSRKLEKETKESDCDLD